MRAALTMLQMSADLTMASMGMTIGALFGELADR